MSARRLVTALAVLLLASPALACSVCGGGNPANRLAFFLSTIALSVLPLGLFAGGILWLRSKLRDQLADEFLDRDTLVISPEPSSVTETGGAPRN